MQTLTELKPGFAGKVIKLDEKCQGFERFRLLDLGVVPGTRISLALDNPLKEPLAYYIRGAVVALRREQTDKIVIEIEKI